MKYFNFNVNVCVPSFLQFINNARHSCASNEINSFYSMLSMFVAFIWYFRSAFMVSITITHCTFKQLNSVNLTHYMETAKCDFLFYFIESQYNVMGLLCILNVRFYAFTFILDLSTRLTIQHEWLAFIPFGWRPSCMWPASFSHSAQFPLVKCRFNMKIERVAQYRTVQQNVLSYTANHSII